MFGKKSKSVNAQLPQVEIQTGQRIAFNNVLRLRTKAAEQELASLVQQVDDILSQAGATKVGGSSTSLYGAEMVDGQQLIDIELNFPLDKPIEVDAPFEFLPEFVIENALVARHVGNPQGVEQTAKALQDYITANELKATTPLYNVAVKEAQSIEELESMIIDFCVGVEN